MSNFEQAAHEILGPVPNNIREPVSATMALALRNADGKVILNASNAQTPADLLEALGGREDNILICAPTGTNAEKGTALRAAYVAAKARTAPNGIARGNANRVQILIAPGTYDLGASTGLTLDGEFVDLIGAGAGVTITSAVTDGSGEHTIIQSASDVRLENFTLTNTGGAKTNYDNTDASAYAPPAPGAVAGWCKNVTFADGGGWSMRVAVEYRGTFIECVGEAGAFGGYGTASGIFDGCTGGDAAFGAIGTASGTFDGCTGGDYAFGSVGTASGTFDGCTGGADSWNAGSPGQATLRDCTITSGTFNFTNYSSGSLWIDCIDADRNVINHTKP